MLEMLMTLGKKAPASLGYTFIAGGYLAIANTNKYTYTDKTVVSGVSLSVARHTSSGVSNSTVGLIAGGENSAVVDKYTLATGALSAGTALNVARGYMGGTGSEDLAVFSGGQNNGTLNTKYTYATDAVVSSTTVMPTSRLGLSGTSAPTYALFAGGSPNLNRTQRFFYADDTTSQGTNLAAGREGMSSFGIKTLGYFCSGKQNTSMFSYNEAYAYANDTLIVKGPILSAVYYAAGAGNATEAYVAGGSNAGGTALGAGYSYSYANEAFVASTALKETHKNCAAFSTPNGML